MVFTHFISHATLLIRLYFRVWMYCVHNFCLKPKLLNKLIALFLSCIRFLLHSLLYFFSYSKQLDLDYNREKKIRTCNKKYNVLMVSSLFFFGAVIIRIKLPVLIAKAPAITFKVLHAINKILTPFTESFIEM